MITIAHPEHSSGELIKSAFLFKFKVFPKMFMYGNTIESIFKIKFANKQFLLIICNADFMFPF